MKPSYATIAEYYRVGLEAGLIQPDDVRSWADGVIAELDQPPAEIIEVSWSKGVPELLENLNTIPGERDRSLAGRWLLGLLRDTLPQSDEQLSWAVRRAMQIAQSTGLGNDTYYQFDLVDDELFLARNGQYGTVAECRRELESALAEYPSPPFTSGT
jgi:hypothetical protein